MRTSQHSLDTVSTIGIDVGKNTFHLVGLDKRGAIVLQQKVTRHQLARRLSNIPQDRTRSQCAGVWPTSAMLRASFVLSPVVKNVSHEI